MRSPNNQRIELPVEQGFITPDAAIRQVTLDELHEKEEAGSELSWMNDGNEAAAADPVIEKDKNLSLFCMVPKQNKSDNDFSFAVSIQQLCAEKLDLDLQQYPETKLASFSRFLPQEQAKSSVTLFSEEECKLHIATMQKDNSQAR